MDEETRRRLLALNRRFYEEGASRFSATRQRPWEGWRQLLPELRAGAPWASLLDLGCGNGRFASFLAAESLSPAAYLGIDGSAALLAEARAVLPSPPHQFLAAGFGELPEQLPGQPFDLAALFGVLHHLPGRAARRDWLEDVASRLAPGGLLVVSFWLLDRFPARFAKLQREADPAQGLGELEAGDALLSFDRNQNLLRYCHFPDDAEIDELCRLPGCRELRRFRADGPSGADNLYAVLRRESPV